MPHDQVHEQLNKLVKGQGGIIGISEDENSLKCWMVSGDRSKTIGDDF